MGKKYETVIGLEVHVELSTKTKIFCSCPISFGEEPNSNICPVCTGMPGSLPVLNKKAVEYAIAVGLGTGCSITQYSQFDRKNYFYPDNPQNYQITQLYMPICTKGALEIETKSGVKNISIREIHLEEDAGKLFHDQETSSSFVDYNRSGIPLIEIVTEPDMENEEEVIAFIKKLKSIIQYLGASDCKLQEGSMRVDVNLSVREAGAKALGVRTEMKNLNSLKAITRAIEGERKRQEKILGDGGEIIQKTRRWDDEKGLSFAMRGKEDVKDYRYFPDPDLIPLRISNQWIEEIKASQPEFRTKKIARFKKEYDIPDYDIELLTESNYMAEFFEKTANLCGNPKKAANWLMVETMRLLKEKGIEPKELKYSPENLAKLIGLVDKKVINGDKAKEVFHHMFEQNMDPEKYVEENGLRAVRDERILKKAVEEVIAGNPKSVEDFLRGKEKVMGFFVGQTMKALKGRGDPEIITQLLKERLKEGL